MEVMLGELFGEMIWRFVKDADLLLMFGQMRNVVVNKTRKHGVER